MTGVDGLRALLEPSPMGAVEDAINSFVLAGEVGDRLIADIKKAAMPNRDATLESMTQAGGGCLVGDLIDGEVAEYFKRVFIGSSVAAFQLHGQGEEKASTAYTAFLCMALLGLLVAREAVRVKK